MTNSFNDRLLQSLLRQADENHVSHAYLFSGSDRATLRQIAETFAKRLVTSPADVLFPEHEKPNLISVDDIRYGINDTVSIKPYGDGRKVYIVDEAEKMNPAAQNALLKTLEEPPAYVVILLLCTNSEVFLQTILSRVVKLSVLTEEEFQEKTEAEEALQNEIRNVLDGILQRELSEVRRFTTNMGKQKELGNEALEEIRSWFRDVLLYKTAPNPTILNHRSSLAIVREFAHKMSFEDIDHVLSAVTEAQNRLVLNVNPELCFQIVFFAIQDAS